MNVPIGIDGLGAVAATVLFWGGLALMVFGIIKLVAVPLAVAFEWRESRRRRRGHHTLLDERPWVSVIVPAYNEGPVLANCVRSLVASDYDRIEVVIVDDGSTDDTPQVAAALAARYAQVRSVRQENAGKGAALNRGIAVSTGEVLFFVDSDGIFAPGSVAEMLRGFNHPDVGAVCGDDRPVNLNRIQTRLLAVLSHAGTGLVRRALTMLGCLPIVSGNVGAFPRAVLEQIGGFDETTVGEDLELTWRVHRAGFRVVFQPRALVYAESPSTLRTLWRQRVRWARGLLQTMRIHASMIGNLRYRTFGAYLVVNTLTMVVMPLLQLLVLASLPLVAVTDQFPVERSVLGVLGWLGIALSLAVVSFAVLLNRAARDLRHLWTLPLWPIYSTALAAVMACALWKEARGGPASWNKMVRTGVVSVAELGVGSTGDTGTDQSLGVAAEAPFATMRQVGMTIPAAPAARRAPRHRATPATAVAVRDVHTWIDSPWNGCERSPSVLGALPGGGLLAQRSEVS
ncbi:glycosyltransferase [Ruania halotolerans]|uniref:glycosyltransferase n=1 Tax=Ruania halotolerans TaxID=2897773 RepID=UPI001E5A5A2E|nr:glycosyltransferase family 2 protein [Ruania halotolerans]UFU06791.1 glycosyltransferase family 2 protein [Ruania halotolerans]